MEIDKLIIVNYKKTPSLHMTIDADIIAMQNTRVIQRNLVFVSGIPKKYANENILLSHDFFGQFGNIKKIALNIKPGEQTMNAYITFDNNYSAEKCIKETDESLIDGKIIKSTFGTTKYCSFYLKNMLCQNVDCMYLHEEGETRDRINKEIMSVKKHKLHSFICVNVGKEFLGRKRNFNDLVNFLLKYKVDKDFKKPQFINFRPVDYQ